MLPQLLMQMLLLMLDRLCRANAAAIAATIADANAAPDAVSIKAPHMLFQMRHAVLG